MKVLQEPIFVYKMTNSMVALIQTHYMLCKMTNLHPVVCYLLRISEKYDNKLIDPGICWNSLL